MSLPSGPYSPPSNAPEAETATSHQWKSVCPPSKTRVFRHARRFRQLPPLGPVDCSSSTDAPRIERRLSRFPRGGKPCEAFRNSIKRALSRMQLSHYGADTVGEWVRRRVESGVGAVIAGGFTMSLQPQQPLPRVPEQTARIARAAFPKGSPYLTLCDRLGTIFKDGHFADLYPQQGQPACPPWRLALITLMQFREGLSDRQAAEAVRARIDWKYLLSLELADAGFDFSVLCEFRDRLLAGGAQE